MDNLELYKQSVNQIFTCLDNLDTYLENPDNTNTINNLREYKDLAISFAKLMSPDVANNNVNPEEVNK